VGETEGRREDAERGSMKDGKEGTSKKDGDPGAGRFLAG
jgi:hypothetical protein